MNNKWKFDPESAELVLDFFIKRRILPQGEKWNLMEEIKIHARKEYGEEAENKFQEWKKTVLPIAPFNDRDKEMWIRGYSYER
jgi:hypothetical protein